MDQGSQTTEEQQFPALDGLQFGLRGRRRCSQHKLLTLLTLHPSLNRNSGVVRGKHARERITGKPETQKFDTNIFTVTPTLNREDLQIFKPSNQFKTLNAETFQPCTLKLSTP